MKIGDIVGQYSLSFTEFSNAIVNQHQFSGLLPIDLGLVRRYFGGLARRLSCPPSLWRSGGPARRVCGGLA